MKYSNLFNEIRFDIKQGIIARAGWFLMAVLVSVVFAEVFFYTRNQMITDGRVSGELYYMDAYMWMFRGMEKYNPQAKEAFDITDSYLVWNFLLAFIIGDYPVRELRTTGKNWLVRSESRTAWWIGKCIWNIITVFLFYICIHIGIVITAFVNNASWEPSLNRDVFVRTFKLMIDWNYADILMSKALLLPILSSLAVSQLQMLLMLILGAITGYAGVVVSSGVSAFYMTGVLPGNGMMVWRYKCITPEGIGILTPIVADMVIVILCVIVGYKIFKKYDVL